jgi:integrase
MAEGRIYQRGKTWSAVVDVGRVPTDQGGTRRKQQTKGGFPTKKAAQQWAREQLQRLDKGTYVAPTKETVGQYLAGWMAGYRARPSTLESYARNVRHHLIPALGHLRLDRLGPEHIRVLIKELETVKELAPRTIHYIITILGKALSDAVEDGKLSRNVATSKTVRRSLPKTVRHQMTTWTGPEVAQFLDLVRDDDLFAPVLLAVTTGLRRGEVLGLRWRDVDLTQNRISIRQTVGDVLVDGKHEAVRGEPKTNRGRRTVKLPAQTVAALRRHKLAQYTGPGHVGFLVFDYPDGSPLHPAAFRMAFSRKVAKTGLPKIRFHDLRHTYATLALQAGVPAKVVSENLGHASIAITIDTYSHVMPGMQEDAADKIEAAIFGP